MKTGSVFKRNGAGFSLLEIIISILIIAIIAAIAFPKVVDLAESARKASEDHTVGAIKEGIYLYYMGQLTK